MENDPNESIDIAQYIALVKRWAWLLALGLLLGAGAGYGASRLQTPIYQAVTKVMITRGGMADQSLDVYSYYYTDQLTQTYLQLLQSQTILAGAADMLGYDLDEVGIEALAVQDTTIIEVSVDHPDPRKTVEIAETLVQVLIEQNERIQSSRYVQMEESLKVQKEQLEEQITQLQRQIEAAALKTSSEQEQWILDQIGQLEDEKDQIQAELSTLGEPSPQEAAAEVEQKNARLAQLDQLLALYNKGYTDLLVFGKEMDTARTSNSSQLTLLTTNLTLYQNLYESVLSNLETVRLAGLQNTPNVVPIEPPTLPEEPIKPRTLLNIALGGMIGLMLVAGVLVLNEYLDNTVKTADDIQKIHGISTIGYIGEMQGRNADEAGMYVSRQPRSPITEAFRSLRTNIEFSAIDRPVRTILVTSPEPGTGKTTVAANLAAIFAQKGRKVLLLDADLRRPHVHQVMGFENRIGLTDLLLENQTLESVSRRVDGNENLTVITSGSLPPNPAELLGSAKMERILAELAQRADVIVIDSPPSIVADSQVLAARVDGVLLVARPGKTQTGAVRAAFEFLQRANARLLGVVLNRISRDGDGYYGRYQSQGYEYTSKK